MTKEEAIERLKNYTQYRCGGVDLVALNMAIQALEQEPCNDTVSRGVFEQVMWERDTAIEQLRKLGYGLGQKIEPCDDAVSRQAVIDALKEGTNVCDLITRTREMRIDIIDVIKALPSVNPCKHGKWISVKERLPQKTSLYLVTVGINDYGMGMYDEVRVAHYNIISGWCVCEDRRTIIGDVSAWMPLPEPYKAESEE